MFHCEVGFLLLSYHNRYIVEADYISEETMPLPSAPELIIIFLVILLLFGGRKLPELARSIGDSMKELRKGMSDDGTTAKKNDKKQSDHDGSKSA